MLKSGIKNGAGENLSHLLNVICDFSYETKFPYKLFLTDTQVLRIRKTFADGSSVYLRFSKLNCLRRYS